MATVDYVEYEEANVEVRQVYDDIMATRQVDWVNNFWKALANGFQIEVDAPFRNGGRAAG